MGKIIINTLDRKSKIDRNIYGHFSEHLGRCIYEGLYVGENSDIPNVNGMRTDVVEALKNIRIPVLRWPGGCFADEYHWKDGIGDKANRKKMVNTHWGGVVEDNSFGTHEFMELCRQLGCEPYINGNVGSGTVQEMSEWVEYLTFDGLSPMAQLREKNGRKEPWAVKYWGVGNENWGCGGNMRPSYYADLYRRFATYVRNYGDNKIFKIACGPSGGDYAWTDTLMEIAGKYTDAITMHHYTVTGDTWEHKGSATEFDAAEYYRTIRSALYMEELVSNHLQIMHKHDPENRVGLIVDEWGTWYEVEPGTNPGFLYQQNTMRDAIVAGATLNIFNSHADRVVMANIAQTVNVLQAMVLTEGPKMLLTPTYHVFDLYKVHQDATLLGSYIENSEVGAEDVKIPQISASASVDENGTVNVTIVNTGLEACADLEIFLTGMKPLQVDARGVSGDMSEKNDFDSPENVTIQPLSAAMKDCCIQFTAPACSVSLLQIKG